MAACVPWGSPQGGLGHGAGFPRASERGAERERVSGTGGRACLGRDLCQPFHLGFVRSWSLGPGPAPEKEGTAQGVIPSGPASCPPLRVHTHSHNTTTHTHPHTHNHMHLHTHTHTLPPPRSLLALKLKRPAREFRAVQSPLHPVTAAAHESEAIWRIKGWPV